MPIYCFLKIFMPSYLLLGQHKYELFGSFALIAPLSSLFLLITLRNQDFWQGFRTKLSALKNWLSFSALVKEEETIELIPELPKSDELPSFGQMAELLVKALPASQRSEAYTLLVTQLLPKKWARRPMFLAPRAQYETIFDRLAEALQQAPPTQRLDLLRTDLCEIEIKQLCVDSIMLAIARYMQEHPDATFETRILWLELEQVSNWSALDIADLEQEALQQLEKLAQWEEFAQAKHPDLWEEYKLESFNAQLNFNSAYSGWFHAAMGELAYFLHDAGEEFNEIRLF